MHTWTLERIRIKRLLKELELDQVPFPSAKEGSKMPFGGLDMNQIVLDLRSFKNFC